MIELLVELHEGLPRLGPGNTESTLRALALCEHLPAAPDILDVGCGTGPRHWIFRPRQSGSLRQSTCSPAFSPDWMRSASNEVWSIAFAPASRT